jgi:ABC-type amino acid transport system permease subunit
MSTDLQHVTFDDLANANKWRFVWGYVWRSLVAAIASGVGGAIAGTVLGFLVGFVAQALGKSHDDVVLMIRILGGVAGVVIAFIVLWQLVRWLFLARWFGYRLRLVRDTV